MRTSNEVLGLVALILAALVAIFAQAWGLLFWLVVLGALFWMGVYYNWGKLLIVGTVGLGLILICPTITSVDDAWNNAVAWFESQDFELAALPERPAGPEQPDTDGETAQDAGDEADQRFFGAEGDQDRVARLVELDAIYWSQGWRAWLKAAGVVCDATTVEARQPEEETVIYNGETRIVVSGLQVDGHCEVPYPAVVTTGDPSVITIGDHTRQHQPDLTNPSVLYTNVILDGDGTIWIDGSNWGQLDPTS